MAAATRLPVLEVQDPLGMGLALTLVTCQAQAATRPQQAHTSRTC